MVFKIIDYLAQQTPTAFILENVEGLLTVNSGKDWKRILGTLIGVAGNHYNIQWKVLDSLKNGIPQSRKRLYIIGFQRYCNPGLLIKPPYPSVRTSRHQVTRQLFHIIPACSHGVCICECVFK